MPGLENMGKALLVLGGLIVLLGLVLLLGSKISFLGRLPGDIRIARGDSVCHIPLATSLLLSILLTVVLNVILRLFRK